MNIQVTVSVVKFESIYMHAGVLQTDNQSQIWIVKCFLVCLFYFIFAIYVSIWTGTPIGAHSHSNKTSPTTTTFNNV